MEPREDGAVYYVDDLIEIADRWLRIGGTTYALAHISTVKVTRARANRMGAALAGALVFGVLGWLGAALVMPASPYRDSMLAVIAMAGVLVGLLVGFVGPQRRYALQVRTSSGDTGQVVSGDQFYIRHLEGLVVRAVTDFYAVTAP